MPSGNGVVAPLSAQTGGPPPQAAAARVTAATASERVLSRPPKLGTTGPILPGRPADSKDFYETAAARYPRAMRSALATILALSAAGCGGGEPPPAPAAPSSVAPPPPAATQAVAPAPEPVLEAPAPAAPADDEIRDPSEAATQRVDELLQRALDGEPLHDEAAGS